MDPIEAPRSQYLSGNMCRLRSIPEQFAETVRRFPDRLAVTERRDASVERFTYSQLDALASGAAARLHAAGIRAGDRCALLGENSARWCAAYLGILRLGAVAVPVATSCTREQAGILLRDAGATVLLASARFALTAREAASGAGCRVLDLHAATDPDAEPAPCRAPAAGSSSPAVILYTSGTTADPRGVVLTHGNLLAAINGTFDVMRLDERDAVLGLLPLCDALAQMANLLLPLSAGAHVVFLHAPDARELLPALSEKGVTVFACAPQFLHLIHRRVLADAGKRALPARVLVRVLLRANGAARRFGINAGTLLFRRVHHALGPRMRLLVTGGSKLDEATGRDLFDLGFTILQAYGLTETSGVATMTRPGEPARTVGRPLKGVQIRIDGEVLIRGPIVMAGYWNRPDATVEALQDGWLRTGDLGRVDAHGRLTITGRRKEVVVLGSGENVSPEEIEAHYRQSPFISEVCVIGAAPGAPEGERLHAVVVPDREVLRERRIVNLRELIRFELEGLSVALPPSKRVAGFDVTLEPLPRTTTGKLIRHEVLRRLHARVAASARAHSRERDGGPHVRDDHLARIVSLVERYARRAAVHPAANLELDLGLDSMSRVELLAAVEARFRVRIPAEDAASIFTVADLAEACRGAAAGDAAADDLSWARLLNAAEPGPDLRALLEPRPVAAAAAFACARVLSRTVRVDARGLEHVPRRGPFIISPNHQSYLDPFVLAGVLPFEVFRQLFFVGAAEYFATPLTTWLARRLNVVPVDPDANLLPAMQAGAFGLRHGKVLVLFPEGERSIDGTVKAFRRGAAILSRHLEAPVVPVAIDGLFDVWPRSRPPAWRRVLPWSGHRVRIRFGPPVPAGTDSYAEHTARLRARVEEMWLAFRGGTVDASSLSAR